MNITPHVNLLKSQRGRRVELLRLICEAVDNSLDAGAQVISVETGKDRITIADDGNGITRDRVQALFSLGRHGPQPTTALGRFGIGITSEAINAGDVLSVVSISPDGQMTATANWRQVLKDNVWAIDDPTWTRAPHGSHNGTTIIISKLRKPPRASTEKIVDELSLRFYPALASGRVVRIGTHKVKAHAEPKMTDVVDRQISLSGDRSVYLRAGLLAGPSRLSGVHVSFKHRVIMPDSRVGCGSYGGLSKMFARVQLSGSWHLAQYKDDLTDEVERDELEEAIAIAIKPILEKCNAAAMTARIRQLTSMVNERLPADLQPTAPGEKSSGKPRATYVKREAKKKRKEPSKDRLIISIDGADEDQGVGKFIAGRPHCVNLSPDNPYVASLIAVRDTEIAASSLLALALSIYLNEHRTELPLEPFGRQLSGLLSIQDGK